MEGEPVTTDVVSEGFKRQLSLQDHNHKNNQLHFHENKQQDTIRNNQLTLL